MTSRRIAASLGAAAILAGGLVGVSTGSAFAAPQGAAHSAVAAAGHLSAPPRPDSSHAVPANTPGLPAPMAGCSWYTESEAGRYAAHLSMVITVLGEWSASGYCGLASDHVCATPDTNAYTGGLNVYNWWYADGNYRNTVFHWFGPYAGQTVCSYSGSFPASGYAEADGSWANENQSLIAEFGVLGYV